ncbi:transforming growth factorbeta receptor [Porites harrisoni]
MVRQVFSPTTAITRAPEVKISFSCHYSKHGIVSTGPLTRRKRAKMGLREAAGQDFASVENICRNELLFFYSGNPTCTARRKSQTTVKKEERTEDRESAP